MPYKDKTKQRKYQLKFMHERRRAWVYANGPCKVCASFKKLEVSYVKKEKGDKQTSSLWSMTESKRVEILKNCEVLCHRCAQAKTRGQKADRTHGINAYSRGCRCETCKSARALEQKLYRYRTGKRKAKDWKLMEAIQNETKNQDRKLVG